MFLVSAASGREPMDRAMSTLHQSCHELGLVLVDVHLVDHALPYALEAPDLSFCDSSLPLGLLSNVFDLDAVSVTESAKSSLHFAAQVQRHRCGWSKSVQPMCALKPPRTPA